MKQKYRVWGWLENKAYDAGANANFITVVTAPSQEHAENTAANRFYKKPNGGRCSVLIAELVK